MIDLLVHHRPEIVALCRRFGVSRLDVFGSAASGVFDPDTSDLDFLVELDPPAGMSRFDAHFGLKEALESLLGLPSELVDPSALANPFFAASVSANRELLYAA